MTARAPIALFVYNRPTHTRETLACLAANTQAAESDLFIFSDGPRTPRDQPTVEAVRAQLKTVSGFKSVQIRERPMNLGLRASVISGVSSVVQRYGRIIVLEDDLLTHSQFLEFMNAALEKFSSEKSAFSVSGYSYAPEPVRHDQVGTCFLKLTCAWGWGTWADRWAQFDPTHPGADALFSDSHLRYRFNYDDALDYSDIMRAQIEGKIDSWAIDWYWTIFRQNGLSVFPRTPLVANIGLDGTGRHAELRNAEPELHSEPLEWTWPGVLKEDRATRALVSRHLRKRQPISFDARLRNRFARTRHTVMAVFQRAVRLLSPR